MKKFKLRGCVLDAAMLSIACYLVKIGTEPESLNFELDYLIGKYGFVENSDRQDFKDDVRNMFFYKYNQKINSIDAKDYAEFKLNSYGRLEAEKELIEDLKSAW